MAEASAFDISLSAESEFVSDTSQSAGSEFASDTALSAGSEFISDSSLSAGSEFVPETSLSAGSEFVFDNVCKPCRSEGKIAEAEKYCQDCRQHLCAQCTGFHKKLFALKDHKLVVSEDAYKEIKAKFVTDIKVKTGLFSVFSRRSKHGICGLALVGVERLVAVDLSTAGNSRLVLIDTTKKKIISEFKRNNIICDVTVCGGEVVATLPVESKIIFLKCDDGLVYVRDLRVDGDCWGIDCVDDKLYVVYWQEKKFEVMTVTGTVLQRFHTDDQGEKLFQDPWYVTVDTVNQRIYVSEYEKLELTVLGLDGKVKDKYKGNGKPEDGFGQLAVDTTSGVMYLCDPGNDTIHLLSPQCKKVKLLLTAQDGLLGPLSVCYCESTRRLYIGMENGIIKVYQIS